MFSGWLGSSCIASILWAVVPLATAQTVNSDVRGRTLRVFPINSRLSKPEPDFAKLKEVLLKSTNVPVQLPSYLPFMDSANPLAASLVSVDSGGYEIALGWGEDCFSADFLTGAGACHYGTLRGSVNAITEDVGKRVSIALNSGLRGYFVGFTCGAHCGDAAISWRQDGYYYLVTLKAGSEKELIKVANSAISRQDERANKRKN